MCSKLAWRRTFEIQERIRKYLWPIFFQLQSRIIGRRIVQGFADALQELQNIAKQFPGIVGEFALKKELDFLEDLGNSEEYQEALDLIFRLVKSKDKVATKKNTDIILEETDNVELLLDLLEHEDPIIGACC